MARICELCKTENDDDAQFCEKCGNPLVEEEEEKDESEDEEEEDEDEEEEEAPAAKPQDLKLLIIPAVLVVIALVIFLFMNMQTGNRNKAARAVVDNYLTQIKAEKYAEALNGATGIAMSPEYEKSFREFLRQLTPDMPVNDNLHKAMVGLASIEEGMDKYRQLNGRYPQNLKQLVPNYLKKLPDAPGGEFGYERSPDNYTIYVKGKLFADAGIPENFPAFSGKEKLQAPDMKNVHGEWKIVGYEIIDVRPLSKDKVQVKVKESVQFGPETASHENVYSVVFQNGKWLIDPESSPIEMLTFTSAYTQMASMGGPAKKPEEKEEKKDPNKKEEKKKEEPKKFFAKIPLGMTLLSFSRICQDPKNLKTRTQWQYRHCKKGMEKIAFGLRDYSNNHSGRYPDHILWLVPRFLDRIPLNPAAGEDTFSPGYQLNDNKERYTIVSQGAYFTSLGINEGFPQYSSKYRLIEKESDIPAEPEVTPEPEGTPNPDESPMPGETPEGDEVTPDGTPTPGEETPGPDGEVTPAPDATPGESPTDAPDKVEGEGEKKEGEDKKEPEKTEDGKEPEKSDDGKVVGDKKEETKPEDKKVEEDKEEGKPEEKAVKDEKSPEKKEPEGEVKKEEEKKSDKKAEVKSKEKSVKEADKKVEKAPEKKAEEPKKTGKIKVKKAKKEEK